MNKSLIFAVCISGLAAMHLSAQTWTDISTSFIQSQNFTFPGGVTNCSGVCVNRLTGDVIMKIIDHGMWKSTDKGGHWARIDNNMVGGRCETAWAVQLDQENPIRIAVFSLDGDAGYTADGTTWKKMTSVWGRNWDFGSVDWSTSEAKVMLAAAHEANGDVFKTTDGASTWTKLSIKVIASGGGATPIAMLGVIDANTFIYGVGNGILRSTDQGTTWASVSTSNPLTHTVMQFKGVFYLGTSTGLLASTDKGATWQKQGASLEIYQGPYFGADENVMFVVNRQGLYKSDNAGTSWTKLTGLAPNCAGGSFDPTWFGGYTWDPINNTIYATRMTCAALKYQLTTSSTVAANRLMPAYDKSSQARFWRLSGNQMILHGKVAGSSIKSVAVYNMLGLRIGQVPVHADGSVSVDSKISRQQIVFIKAQ